MKHGLRNLTALLMAVLMLMCLCPEQAAFAENTAAEESQTTEQTTKTKMSASELQAQGILTVGAKGEEVTKLQQRLKDLGYLDGKVDGQYGGGTKRAVIAFQRRNGLTTDGVAGQETQSKLYAEDAKAAPGEEKTDVLAGDVPMLINKEHTVDEFFTPADLVLIKEVIGKNLATVKYKKTMGVRKAVEALKEMLEAAAEDGLNKKWQISAAYRSWDQQVSMLNQKTSAYKKKNKGWSSSKARRAALRSVAEPGSSEHHLGLAFDINKQGSSNFAGTKHSAWLNEHCWEYGFIIRYQKEKEEITGFIAEPWHIRYVGVEHAKYMKEHNLCLEEYIQGIEDGTIVIGGGAAEAPAEEGNTEEETAEEPADSEAPEDTGDGAEDAGTPDDLLEDLPEDSDEEPDEGAAA